MQGARSLSRAGPLSILHVHGRFDGGPKDQRVVALMNHWGQRARHDIILAEPGADQARASIDPAIEFRFLDEPAIGPEGGPGRHVALAQVARHYDLVLSYGWGALDALIMQRLLGLLMGLPPLIHHEDGEDIDAIGPLGFGSDFYRRYSLSAAKALVVPTGRMAHIAIERWQVPALHVQQIPDGIDVASFGGKRLRSEIAGELEDDCLFVGARVEDASAPMIDQLLRACAPHRKKARLVLLDAPCERDILLARAYALGLSNILIPDRLPRAQDYLGALDIFVALSESISRPQCLAEAMAAGLPVLTTDVADASDMLAAGNRPFVVPAGDDAALAKALGQLIDDADLRARLGHANQCRAQQCFDRQMTFDLFARLYGGAVGHPDALI